jgi:hypothetical protein
MQKSRKKKYKPQRNLNNFFLIYFFKFTASSSFESDKNVEIHIRFGSNKINFDVSWIRKNRVNNIQQRQ